MGIATLHEKASYLSALPTPSQGAQPLRNTSVVGHSVPSKVLPLRQSQSASERLAATISLGAAIGFPPCFSYLIFFFMGLVINL